MGLMQRRKGRRFEQDIAARIRERFGANVRRASQAERADNPDVFVDGGPPEHGTLRRLWLELQDSRHPTPIEKLEQAERDVESWLDRHHMRGYRKRFPVAIWHRLGERKVYATMRITTLLDIVQPVPDAESELRQVVTVELEQFFEMLEAA